MHNRESLVNRLPAITEIFRFYPPSPPVFGLDFISRPRCDLLLLSSPPSQSVRAITFSARANMLRASTNFLVLSVLTWTAEADSGFKLGGITDNQIYFSKAPRFIKFDSKDDEVEIELGVSIPVVKVPLSPHVGRTGERKESAITVSPPGLVVAGVLLLTTFLVIPLLFSKKTYRAGKTGDSDDVWSVMKQIENGFYNNFVESTSCVENLICWTAKRTEDGEEGSIEHWANDVLRSEWMTRLVNGTFVEKAILAGRSRADCWEKYKRCPPLEKLYASLKRQTKSKKTIVKD